MIKPLRERLSFNPPKMGKFSEHTHPFIVKLWEEIVARKVSLSSVAEAAGVERASIHKWRKSQRGPYFLQLEAVINALGYEFQMVKVRDVQVNKSWFEVDLMEIAKEKIERDKARKEAIEKEQMENQAVE